MDGGVFDALVPDRVLKADAAGLEPGYIEGRFSIRISLENESAIG